LEVAAPDRIGVRHTLGFALTGTRNCTRGIDVLQDALAIAENSPQISRKSVGYSEYVLGSAYWHCGVQANASKWLERGTDDMKADYGWGRAMYINAMKQYARFLQQDGRKEAALSAQAVVSQAESVVDANSLADKSTAFRSAGFK
jgi:hypothetical protein